MARVRSGLAPSAAAADVLATSLSIECENTAKWLHDPTTRTALRRPGRLVIVDEASLASTPTFNAITRHAVAADAKVVLVGDHHQLSAVEAGSAIGLLARRTLAAELAALWRFHHRWEADATRLHDGTHEEMVEAAYTAWHTDTTAGQDSLLLAADGETVTALNARARTDRILANQAAAQSIPLRDRTTAGIGDRIITRLNARALTDRTGRYVRNGDAWTVVHAYPDGDVYAIPAQALPEPVSEPRSWMGRDDLLVIPNEYVTEHVQLGDATTVHRAQGATADTCHIVTSGPDGTMTREHLYVALTRGRTANTAYTPTDHAGAENETQRHTGPTPNVTCRDVLDRILASTGAELSATEHIEALHRSHAEQAWAQVDGALSRMTPDAHPSGPTIGL